MQKNMETAKNHTVNLVDHFVDRHLREGRGNTTAIISGDSAQTYQEVARDVNRTGNGLLRLGVREKSRVLLILPDGPEFVASYFGAMKIGAVVAPTATGLSGADYAHLVAESCASVVIVHSRHFPEVAPLVGCLPFLRSLIVVGAKPTGYIDWESWIAGNSARLAPVPVGGDGPAFWRWTGGPASSKVAVHQHADWICCCENYAANGLEIAPEDVIFSLSRLSQVRGLGNGLMAPFNVGAGTILRSGGPRAGTLIGEIERSGGTVLFATPAQYEAMLRETERKRVGLSRVRLAVSVAEPLSYETYARWHRRFGVQIVDAMHLFATRKRAKWQHWRSGARALYGQQILGRQ
jgi:benzoate-CoA ligase